MTGTGIKSLLATLVLIVSAPLTMADVPLADTIDYLLRQVAESNYVFIRNGKDHDSEDAAKHMRRKFEHFADEIATPEQFIDRSATKSMMTGKRYRVRFPDGKEMDTADWLREELTEFRAASERVTGDGE